jgi:DNA-binding transcriptional MerR regulator
MTEVRAAMTWTVGEVAKLAKVSVRTLHHYDAIGLLEPTERSGGGYRLYGMGDLEHLQQVLFFRELGFALDDIRRIMLEPDFDRRRALTAQRLLLAEKTRRTEAMLEAIDAALDAMQKGTQMDKDEMFEVFGDFDPSQYEDEARERWGDTGAYKESMRRTSGYTKQDWKRIKVEQDAITAAFVGAMDAGLDPASAEVGKIVERHWRSINDNFYTCPLDVYEGLGEMYVADPRFTKSIGKARPGLAAFQRDAIKAWVAAKRAE